MTLLDETHARYSCIRDALVIGRDAFCSDEHRKPFDDALAALSDLSGVVDAAREFIENDDLDYIAELHDRLEELSGR